MENRPDEKIKAITESVKKQGRKNVLYGSIFMIASAVLFIFVPIVSKAEDLRSFLILGSVMIFLGLLYVLLGVKRCRFDEEKLKMLVSKAKNQREETSELWDFSEKGFNRNVERRDQIIFGEYAPDAYSGGIRNFDTLSLKRLMQLIKEGFADPKADHNDSPTIEEMVAFSEKWEGKYVFGGYAVEVEREDYRVSIISIRRRDTEDLSEEEKKAFIAFAGEADEFDEETFFAWWD